MIPSFLLTVILIFIKFLNYTLELEILGLKKNHFGSSLFMDVS